MARKLEKAEKADQQAVTSGHGASNPSNRDEGIAMQREEQLVKF
jgi:hypothetical protein